MADEVQIDQLHINVYVAADLPEGEAEAARRVLESARFRRRLERAVRNWFRRHCAPRRAEVTLSA